MSEELDKIKRQDFLDKIKNLSSEAAGKSEIVGREQLINDELKLETLLFLKSQITSEEALTDLKLLAARRLIQQINEDDGEISPMVLVKVIETIGKIENDKASNILGVLKQQITVQQNIQQNFPSPFSIGSSEKIISDDTSLNKEDFKKVRKVYDFVNKLRQAELNQNEIQSEEKEIKGE